MKNEHVDLRRRTLPRATSFAGLAFANGAVSRAIAAVDLDDPWNKARSIIAAVVSAALFVHGMSRAETLPLPAAKPVRLILVGDSTMAAHGGYGDALCARLQPSVTCLNLAKAGRSSSSFRADGLWDQVQKLLRAGADYKATYVLIQFGHDDQPGKPERSTDLETEFPANLARYASEAAADGAVPVLVTPPARRIFENGKLTDSLAPWATATSHASAAQHVALLDLNALSVAAVEAMGPEQSRTLAPDYAPDDTTHLGARGAEVFAMMVLDELGRIAPEVVAARNRPQLSPEQVAHYDYSEVLKYVGLAGHERIDPWDPLSDPLATGVAFKPDYTVDPTAATDGHTVFATVHEAINRAIADSGTQRRLYVLVRPGVYHELVYVPAASVPITLYSDDPDARHTRIRADLAATTTSAEYAARFGPQFAGSVPAIAAMYDSVKVESAIGTFGTPTVWIRNNGFQARNITFENYFNENRVAPDCDDPLCAPRRDPSRGRSGVQAVAVLVEGADKAQFENARFIGNQDTLFLRSAAVRNTVRAFFHKSYVEGDVDFIFGDTTAYFYRSEIKSLGTRAANSYATAPNTNHLTRYGFVFNECRFTNDGSPNALAGTFHLARQWFHRQKCTPYASAANQPGYTCSLASSDGFVAPHGTVSPTVLETVGKTVILNSQIGAHIDAARPWSDWNRRGLLSYRPVQYDSDDFWANLVAAGIDPERDLGYTRQATQPYLAEFNNRTEPGTGALRSK